MAIPEYGRLDGLALAELVRRREVTPAELIEEAIRRAERVNPRIGAIVTPLYDRARAEAAAAAADAHRTKLPFAGLPLLLKDLDAALAGVPQTACSRLLANYIPARDSTIVDRFRAAGAIVFGRTATPELGLLPYTEPAMFGPARNPWNLELTPGGSSGGAAAAVAAGIVPLAHANDGGGSIRIPASCCGLFGLKPTRGRTPVGPDRTQLWSGFAIGHVISRSVRDSAAMLDAIAGPETTSPYVAPPPARPFLDEVGAPPGRLRVALSKRGIAAEGTPHADCVAAADDAARLLADLGHHVEEVDVDADADAFGRAFFLHACIEIAAIVARVEATRARRARRSELETNTAIAAIIGRQQSAVRAVLTRESLDAVACRAAAVYAGYDVVLSPTLASPPVRLGGLAPRGLEAFGQELVVALHLGFLLRIPGVVDPSVRRVLRFMPYTPLANVTGQPAMNVPLYWNAAGVPIGVQFQARLGDEATLLRLAAQLEAARPWRDRRPPVHADD
jgi:amidase